MGYKPSFKKPGEDIDIRVQSQIEKAKAEFEEKIRSETDKRINEILKERETKEKADKAAKLEAAVDKAKSIRKETGEKSEKDDKKNDHDRSLDKGIDCPSCHTGHVHKVVEDKTGYRLKCNGDKCGWEAVVVPKNSDYKCAKCGAPIKKPEDDAIAKEMPGCLFCGTKKAVKFDWQKLWDVKR